jgi:hypothetical protein
MRAQTRWGLVVLSLLLAVLAVERLGPVASAPQAGGEVAGDPADAGEASAGEEPTADGGLAALEQFAVIGERTLFSSTRRPPEPPEAPATTAKAKPAPPPPPPPDLEVHAIVREGERWLAVISRIRGGEPAQAQPGDVVHGWEVVSISPETVELRAGSRSVSLRLRPEVVPPR